MPVKGDEELKNQIEIKSFKTPDEVRTFDKGKLELVKVGKITAGRATFEPGWRWSQCVQPIAKTKSCQVAHFQYQLAGILKVVLDDGTEKEIRAGEIAIIPAGHDAWVVGNESAVGIDFQGAAVYAKPAKNDQKPGGV